MENYDERTYGDRIAEVYDEMASSYEEACIDRLFDLAKEGPVLELGIGTGRIALPLHHKGVDVHGIDSSKKMLEKLQSKPGGKGIPLTVGNFGDIPVEGKFSLIFVVFNTFYALLTQDEQIRCFQNAAQHLKPGGVFLIDAFVPDLARFTDHQTFRVVKMDVDQVNLDANQHDPVKQQITSQHILITNEGTQLFPVKIRYAWPSEMDLMAQLAGLELRRRWGDWERGPFTAESGKHISVYG